MQATGHAGALTEPFAGLFTQGMVVHETYRSKAGEWLFPSEIRLETDDSGRHAYPLESGEEVAIGAIEKMSKSKRNTVDPDDIISAYGADTARWFVLSDSPPERDVIWTEEGVQGAAKFVQRLWRLVGELARLAAPAGTPPPGNPSSAAMEIRRAVHMSLIKVEEDIERLRFNRAVAQVHDLANKLSAAIGAVETTNTGEDIRAAFREGADILVTDDCADDAASCRGMLGGCSAMRIWRPRRPGQSRIGPLLSRTRLRCRSRSMGGSGRTLLLRADAGRAAIEAAALALEPVRRALDGRPVKKIIIVPQRIVNVVG